MVKNKLKIFIIIVFVITILVSIILGNIEKIEKIQYLFNSIGFTTEEKISDEKDLENEKKEEALINIDSLSDDFMEQYFNGMKELNDLNNKSNMLIVTSEKDIGDGYGAIKVVVGPNNQYFLQYNNEEDKNYAFKKFKEDKKIFAVTENTFYTIEEVSNYNLNEEINYNWPMEKNAFSYALEELKNKNLNDVIVAVVDTGCEVSVFNEAYPGRLLETYNVLDKTSDVTDKWRHGTFVSGIIAQTTPSNVKILPIKVKNKYDGGSASDLIDAINYAIRKDVDVINFSLSGGYDKNLEVAINSAAQKGITIVAAAGNENKEEYRYPAAYNNVIGVSAVDSHFERANFSSYGDYIDFAAPGYQVENIYYTPIKDEEGNTLYFESSRVAKNGTSYASPYVAGAVAILKSVNIDEEAIFTKEDIVELLSKHAIDVGKTGYDKYYGHGVISFEGAKFANEDVISDKYGIFEKNEISTYSATRIETSKKFVPEYNYGNNTNIMKAEIDIYYTEEAYYTKTLGQLLGEIEILDYEPFNYTEQNVHIKYKNLETILKVDNRNLSNGWEYVFEDDGTIKLTGMNCKEETLTSTYDYSSYPQLIYVPSTIDGKNVKTLGENLFIDKNKIKRIVILYGIRGLERNMFGRTKALEDSEYSLYGLTEIVLAKSVQDIDAEAFKFRNKNEIKLRIFNNTPAYQYAVNNDYNHAYISSAKIKLEKKNYYAFEEVTEKFTVDITYDGTEGVYNEVVDKYNIIYDNGDSFRYGDKKFIVSFETKLGNYVEVPFYVTIDKAIPEYTLPTGLKAIEGQTLSEIKLPSGFEWINGNQKIEGVGNVTYKAKYIPEDTINYETVENIPITITIKGHTEVIDKAVEATCTEEGLTEGKHCSECGMVLVEQKTIAAKGHTESIDKGVEATCTEEGLTEGKHCSVCGKILVAQSTIQEKGHNYENGICTLCGNPELKIKVESEKYTVTNNTINEISPKTTIKEFLLNIIYTKEAKVEIYQGETKITDKNTLVGTGMTLKLSLNDKIRSFTLIVNGDTTGDGIVDFKDIVKINRHRLKKKLLDEINLVAAEVNGDGVADFKDIVTINKYRLNRINTL